MEKIAVIGAGQMGGALLRGLALKGEYQLALLESDLPRGKAVARETAARQFTSVREAGEWADAVVIAVKPQVFSALSREMMECCSTASRKSKVVISMMAGITLQQLRTSIGIKDNVSFSIKEEREQFNQNDSLVVVRVMPNLPLVVGAGAIAVADDGVPPKVLQKVLALFNSVGSTVSVSESLMDAVTGLSGSGPAWVFQFIEGLVSGGVKMGLPRQTAEELVLKTIEGSVKMIRSGAGSAANLTDKVSSPGGTTLHGLQVLETSGFRGVLMKAVEAAALRSHQLGR